MNLKKIAQMVKTYQAMPPMPPGGAPPMPPGGMPPMPPGGAPPMPPMPQGGAPMPPDAGGMPPMPPQGPDPLLDYMIQVFGQLPPGMLGQILNLPDNMLVDLTKQGQIPGEVTQLIMMFRQGGDMGPEQPKGQ